ncbi:MAG: SpoVR family protein, partial [Phycisphaerales bacterium]|nr:SpoVR family protein [Phycisphaerales bacterium]
HLEKYRAEIEDRARAEGLDFYETIFEMVDFDQINQIAAYGGFPTRYPHWRFGMEYERLRKQHTYGLGKIYEMVINNDPCYAYLLDDNELVDQKTVMAHVYGHCDFFKNNYWFSRTSRKMMDGMANHATRVSKHIEREGQDAVERFIDVCLSIDSLIDPHSPFMQRQPRPVARETGAQRRHLRDEIESRVVRYQAKPYMERYINPPERLQAERDRAEAEIVGAAAAFPARPERDVLAFLLRYAPLADWQADILQIIRDEAYYFAPQGQTKIMNEGWATYWHSRMMTRYHLRDDELITYCDHHSGTLATSPGRLNPYKMGVELLRDIEDRWNRGRFGKEFDECTDIAKRRAWDTGLNQGREKIFEVRRIHNDVTFIDEFLTPEFVDRYQLYHYRHDPATGRIVAVDRDFNRIKQRMLFMLTNHGQPYIYVVDGNYGNRGELYLAHKHVGIDLDIKYASATLSNIQRLWRRPVSLQARINDDMMLFVADGETVKQHKISESTPPPAHVSIT